MEAIMDSVEATESTDLGIFLSDRVIEITTIPTLTITTGILTTTITIRTAPIMALIISIIALATADNGLFTIIVVQRGK